MPALPPLRLARLRLSNCSRLEEVQVAVCSLTELQLEGLPTLAGLELASSAARALSLVELPSLAALRLACPSRERLELRGCRAAGVGLARSLAAALDVGPTGSGLLQFGAGQAASWALQPQWQQRPGALPMLTSLALDCEGLTTLELSAPQLGSLSVAGCSALQQLRLTAPLLHHLHMRGCSALVELTVKSDAGPKSLSLAGCLQLRSIALMAGALEEICLDGCSSLNSLKMDCPRLARLDAAYCGALSGAMLTAALSSCPSLREVVVPAVGLKLQPHYARLGLVGLAGPRVLRRLDLSFARVSDRPLFHHGGLPAAGVAVPQLLQPAHRPRAAPRTAGRWRFAAGIAGAGSELFRGKQRHRCRSNSRAVRAG